MHDQPHKSPLQIHLWSTAYAMMRSSVPRNRRVGPRNARLRVAATTFLLAAALLCVASSGRSTVVRLDIATHPASHSSTYGPAQHGAVVSGADAAAAAQKTRTSRKISKNSAQQQLLPSVEMPTKEAFKRPTAGTPTPIGKHFSQQGIGQDQFVDKILQGMTGGFFVESGAFDGVAFSNTLFLEATRKWTGLLVEANPPLYQKVLQRSNRTALAVNACLSPTGQHAQLDFVLGDAIGGLSGYMPESHKQRIQREIDSTPGGVKNTGPTNTGGTVLVECWPLQAMMAALGRTRIDYWSLDTEGSEASILNATDFEALDIRVMTVEVNDGDARHRVESVMASKPYRLVKQLSSDLVYVKIGDPALAVAMTV